MIYNIINAYRTRTKYVEKPSTSSVFTFDNTSHTPTITGYDPTAMEQSGTINASKSGSYSVTYTLKKGYAWKDKTKEPVTITWTIVKRVFSKPVYAAGNSTYDGDSKSLTVSRFDSAYMSAGGTLSAVNAGTYTAIYSLRYPDDTTWEDGTNANIPIAWTIYKAAGSVWLSAPNGTINPGTAQISFTVGSNSGAGISVSSSNTGAVNTWNSGYTVYCKKNGSGHGDSTITVNLSESTNYTGAFTTYTCYARTHWDNDLYNHGWRSGDLTLINADEHFAVYHYLPEESDTAWMNNWNGTIQLYANKYVTSEYDITVQLPWTNAYKGKKIHFSFTAMNGAGGYIKGGRTSASGASWTETNINVSGDISVFTRYNEYSSAKVWTRFYFYGETTIVIDRIWITD